MTLHAFCLDTPASNEVSSVDENVLPEVSGHASLLGLQGLDFQAEDVQKNRLDFTC